VWGWRKSFSPMRGGGLVQWRRRSMSFQAGDPVVHGVYGLGKVLELDEKELLGKVKQYYVVEIRDLTLWVPISQGEPGSLRPPAQESEFVRLFDLLRQPGNPLSEDRLERKMQLSERMRVGSLESVGCVVRDLTHHGRSKKLNENDQLVLQRARNFLLNEWTFVFAVPLQQAEKELDALLKTNASQ
jgi:CarD family transcriptional regulator